MHDPPGVIKRSRGAFSPAMRRATLWTIGAACVVTGAGLTGAVLRPGSIAGLDTPKLLGIVLLMGAPGMTMLAIRLDRTLATARRPRAYASEHNHESRPRVASHTPHDRGSPLPTKPAEPRRERVAPSNRPHD